MAPSHDLSIGGQNTSAFVSFNPTTGDLNPCDFIKAVIAVGYSSGKSMLTSNMRTLPLDAAIFFSNQGISRTQGPHQVAKKLITVGAVVVSIIFSSSFIFNFLTGWAEVQTVSVHANRIKQPYFFIGQF